MTNFGQGEPSGTDGLVMDLKGQGSRGRFSTNEEPRLDDLLDDPIIARLMASDGLHRDAVAAVVRDAQARLGAGV